MAPVAQTGAGNVTTATIGSGSSLTIGKPSSLADGDFLVAILNHANLGATWTTVPAGWTSPTGGIYTAARTSGIWGKPIPSAAAETAADYTWAATGAGSARMGGLIVRVTGADLADPWDVVGSWQAALGASGVTTARPNCLLVGAFWSYISGTTPNTVSPPAGMSSVGGWSVSPSSSTTHLLAAEDRPTPGATGSRTATATPSGSSALSVLAAIAAPLTASVTMTQTSALSAAAHESLDASVTMAQTSALTADGVVPDLDMTASVTMSQTSALVVAEPGQSRILSAGVWRPYTSRRMVTGDWIPE